MRGLLWTSVVLLASPTTAQTTCLDLCLASPYASGCTTPEGGCVSSLGPTCWYGSTQYAGRCDTSTEYTLSQLYGFCVGTTCVPGPSDPPSPSPTTLEPTQAPTSCEDVLASCKDDPTFAYQGDRRKTCGWIYHKKPSFCARDDVVQSCPYACRACF
mmetsp:Transcript_15651/g.48513  ORF Transcript_15651/g.48513 Transcript_15651/m.48513 type:complete len:157 (-) Transcript_15651:73-543(-)